MYRLCMVFILFLLMYNVHRIRVVIDIAEPMVKSFCGKNLKDSGSLTVMRRLLVNY